MIILIVHCPLWLSNLMLKLPWLPCSLPFSDFRSITMIQIQIKILKKGWKEKNLKTSARNKHLSHRTPHDHCFIHRSKQSRTKSPHIPNMDSIWIRNWIDSRKFALPNMNETVQRNWHPIGGNPRMCAHNFVNHWASKEELNKHLSGL